MLKRSKKTKLAAIVVALSMSAVAVTATNASAYCLIGDVDGDGMVDATDASQVLSYYADCSCGRMSYICTDVADVDGDGKVDATDASSILSYYADLSIGKDAVWERRLHNHDKVTLKPGFKWTIKEWPDFSSETTAFIGEENQVYIIDKDVFSDWYQVEFDDNAIGYINVTDGEMAEYFTYETYKDTNPVTTTTATTSTTSKVTTTTTAVSTSTVTSSDASKVSTTTTKASSEQTHMCKLNVKFGYTWAVKSTKDVDSDTIYMTSDVDTILTVSKSGNWYYVIVNEETTGYMNITDAELDKYFTCMVLGPTAK